MCGIAGILAPQGGELLRGILPMLSSMERRGPDDEGVSFHGRSGSNTHLEDRQISAFRENGGVPSWAGLALGHRRLSIIDLSAAGHQPMTTTDGRFTIVYNGEVYNFVEIRTELEGLGVTFRSATDTEVVLEAYRKWGRDCVSRFNGMWAFAIWDSEAQELFCSRDRIGIKPFYYHCRNGLFLFGSDIKALIASRCYQPVPDWEGVYHALSVQCAPRPRTCFEDVSALRQGHCMRVSAEGEIVEDWSFWDLPVPAPVSGQSDDAWIEEGEEILKRSIRRRLVADVPVGTFMSGGIDSTTISALAAQEHSGIKAFNLDFKGDDHSHSEFSQARETAEMYGMELQVKRTDPAESLQHVADMVRCYEEPTPSLSPTYLLSQFVKECGVKVVFSGLGPDELFCGYGRDRNLGKWRWLRRFATLPGGPALLRKLFVDQDWAKARDIDAYYMGRFSALSEETKQRLFDLPEARDWNTVESLRTLYGTSVLEGLDDIQALCWLELKIYIGNHHVYRSDQFTMRHSIESRFPALDHELVEYAARVPTSLKVRDGQGKYLMRRIARRHIAPACLEAPKRGFSLPMKMWIEGELAPLVNDSLDSLKTRGVLNVGEIERVQQSVRQGRCRPLQVWELVSVELWLEEFFS